MREVTPMIAIALLLIVPVIGMAGDLLDLLTF